MAAEYPVLKRGAEKQYVEPDSLTAEVSFTLFASLVSHSLPIEEQELEPPGELEVATQNIQPDLLCFARDPIIT